LAAADKKMFFSFVSMLLCLDVTTGYVKCPYCDPNYMAFPNLEEAMRGYDVPMGNPTPGRGDSDPGIRNQIFVPMYRNSDGHYQLETKFITANTQIKVYNQLFHKEHADFLYHVVGR
jgi:hypothetical protein